MLSELSARLEGHVDTAILTWLHGETIVEDRRLLVPDCGGGYDELQPGVLNAARKIFGSRSCVSFAVSLPSSATLSFPCRTTISEEDGRSATSTALLICQLWFAHRTFSVVVLVSPDATRRLRLERELQRQSGIVPSCCISSPGGSGFCSSTMRCTSLPSILD